MVLPLLPDPLEPLVFILTVANLNGKVLLSLLLQRILRQSATLSS